MSEDSAKEAARKRNEAWERMNCPVAPAVLTQAQYEREYRSRMRFINRSVLESWQSATKSLVCPACLVEGEHGSLIGGKLFICIEDDILTTFKAMAHCICHRCGFEEYYPMTHDPRAISTTTEMLEQERRMLAYNQQLAQAQQAMQNVAGIAQRSLGNQMANQMAQQFPGWSQDERNSLLNLYNPKKKTPP